MRRIGNASASARDALDAVRYQEPRLRRLAELGADDLISAGLALARRAGREAPGRDLLPLGRRAPSPTKTPITRVTNVARGLVACGVRSGDRVGVVMGSRPSFFSVVTALRRLGAVAVVAPPESGDQTLAAAFARASVTVVIADPTHVSAAARPPTARCWSSAAGGARPRPRARRHGGHRPASVAMPEGLGFDLGRARDPSDHPAPSERGGQLRAATVTNHRWALSALGAAATCTLKPDDTVYCCVPLHHPAAILVSVGAALVGGARLALADVIRPGAPFADVRRYGATVVVLRGRDAARAPLERPLARRSLAPAAPLRGQRHARRSRAPASSSASASALEFYAVHHAEGDPRQRVRARSWARSAAGSQAARRSRSCAGSGARSAGPRRGRLARPVLPGEPGLLVARAGPRRRGPGGEGGRGSVRAGDRWFVSADVVGATRTATTGSSTRSPASSAPFAARSPRAEIEAALYGMPGRRARRGLGREHARRSGPHGRGRAGQSQ